MFKHSIFKNTLYAFLLQFFNMIFPLFTAPYISRVIGAEGLGKVNFSASIVNWFVLIATFGTMTYGMKEVAKRRDDNHKLACFFSEMMLFKIGMTIITIAVYLPSIFIVERFSREYVLFLIQGITLILNIFSIDWLFQGLEDYKYITTRSILLKLISLIMLFILVKAKEDYLIYAGISIFALSFSNILNYIYSRKYVRFTWKKLSFKPHITSLAVFFSSSMVVSIYILLDQVLLGFIKGDKDVALFVRAKMLLGCGMTLSNTVSNVIMPRLNNYFVNNKERYSELLRISADIMLMVSVPVAVGTAVLANDVMFLFGGQEFTPASIALIIVSPLAVIVPIGTWSYQQRILPLGYEKVGLYTQVIMATVSVLSNIILIPIFGFIGAAISYVFAEATGDIVGLTYTHKKDGFRTFTVQQLKFLVAAGGMAGVLILAQTMLNVSWLSLFASTGIGIIVYFAFLFLMKEKIIISILNILFSKLKFHY